MASMRIKKGKNYILVKNARDFKVYILIHKI